MDTCYRLYLGRDIGGLDRVSDEDLREFYRDVVTKRFPGFSVWNIQGYWEGKPEDSAVVEICAEGDWHTEKKVEEIAEEYCEAFRQSSVLVTRTAARVEFVERVAVALKAA